MTYALTKPQSERIFTEIDIKKITDASRTKTSHYFYLLLHAKLFIVKISFA